MADDNSLSGLGGQFEAAAQRGLGLASNPASVLGGATAGQVGTVLPPWAQFSDSFFPPVRVLGDRWDKIYPYRLLVVDVENGNAIVGPGAAGGDDTIDVRVQIDSSTISAVPINKWEFVLPITPQQISFVDNYAIQTTSTFRGVLEEHNGVKFKLINAQGTTGIWPSRPSYDMPPIGGGGVASFFAGTLGAVQGLFGSVQKLANTFQGKPPYAAPAAPTVPLDQTGYYQAQMLGQFLEQYAMAKKDPANKGWRLIFDVPKDNVSYVVTPVNFSLTKSHQRPMEHIWSFQLRAWKRIDLQTTVQQLKPAIPPLNSNLFHSILNALDQARTVVQGSLNLLQAVRSDVEGPLTILRQATLLVKDLAGVPQAVSELPKQIAQDYKSAIMDNLTLLQSIGTNSSTPTVQSQVAALSQATQGNEGLSVKAVQGGNLGASRASFSTNDPAYSIFTQPAGAYQLFSQVPLTQLTLNDAQKSAFDAEVLSVRQLSVSDLKTQRQQLRDLAMDITNRYGANSALVNAIYGRPAPSVSLTPMTLDQSELPERLWDVIQGFDNLTATTFLDQNKVLNPLQYVGQLAAQSGVDFNATSQSKVLVPVPFNLSMEEIAFRYLGDRNRYLEIVTLNALREPYIDETGFTNAFLSNGDGRQFTISDASNMWIGQNILLLSTNVTQFNRNVTDIEQLNDTTYLITVDGAPDLSDLLQADGASMKAYLPGTVNSQDQIYVPSDLPAQPDDGVLLPNGITSSTIVGLSKVDILLTDQRDVAVDAFGDFRLAAGLTNLIQALNTMFATELGSWVVNPDFGIGAKPGIMTSDVRVRDLFNQVQRMIAKDQRFQGVSRMQITLVGPTLQISLVVALKNQSGVVPITFVLANGYTVSANQ